MSLVKSIQSGLASLKQKVLAFKNANFLESTMAACAMVAYAEGPVEPEEKQTLMARIEQLDALSRFDSHAVLRRFNHWMGMFDYDARFASNMVLAQLGTLRGKDQAARTLIQICLSIGAVDASLEPAQKDCLIAICLEVGLNPTELSV